MPSPAAPCTTRWAAAFIATTAFMGGSAGAETLAGEASRFDDRAERGIDLDLPPLRRTPAIEFESSPWQALARGTLLRAQLDSRSSLALKLRGGRIGLYLQVQLNSDPRDR